MVWEESEAACKICLQTSALKAPLETLFRDAWKALRFDFPTLSVVAEGSKKKYLPATAERVQHWIEETFSVNTVLSAKEIVPTLHLQRLPYLIFLPLSSEIIFTALTGASTHLAHASCWNDSLNLSLKARQATYRAGILNIKTSPRAWKMHSALLELGRPQWKPRWKPFEGGTLRLLIPPPAYPSTVT
ncbi:hypothetical protein BDR22DRAFT_825708 [Usnea florida]